MKIGITISESKSQYYINQAYIDYIHEVGMQAFIITKSHNIDMITDMLDGLILPGGVDIDPIYYGEDNYTSLGTNPEKDEFERTVFHAFRKIGKPIFGICRGFQLIIREYLNARPKLNDLLDFWTDIPGHNQINDQQLDRSTCQHFVDFFPNLLYGKNVETTTTFNQLTKTLSGMPVNSMHHQALIVDFSKKSIVKTPGFRIIAWTVRGLKSKKHKGVCEAFQILDWKSPILAVQWHPEELKDLQLIHNFFFDNHNLIKENKIGFGDSGCENGKLN